MDKQDLRKPKIALIGQKTVPSREGGVEKTVERQALLLASRGWDVLLLNRGGRGKKTETVFRPQ